MFQVNALKQDAFEVLRLIWSMKNGFGPINRIPPDVLTLIPNSWGKLDKGLFFGGVPYLREIGLDGVPLASGG